MFEEQTTPKDNLPGLRRADTGGIPVGVTGRGSAAGLLLMDAMLMIVDDIFVVSFEDMEHQLVLYDTINLDLPVINCKLVRHGIDKWNINDYIRVIGNFSRVRYLLIVDNVRSHRGVILDVDHFS